MQIDFSKARIEELSRIRNERTGTGGEAALVKIMFAAAERNYMTRSDLMAVANWKWRGGRTRQLCGENTDAEIEEITATSFTALSERLRIGALLALRGVHWPMASVILHFAFPNKYPILDQRAMRTVGGSTQYTFERWQEYVELCRNAATEHGIDIRTLDNALWMADKESA